MCGRAAVGQSPGGSAERPICCPVHLCASKLWVTLEEVMKVYVRAIVRVAASFLKGRLMVRHLVKVVGVHENGTDSSWPLHM